MIPAKDRSLQGRMPKFTSSICSALSLLAGTLVLSAGIASAAQPIAVKIGMPAPLTGPSANFGDAMVKGAQIAIDETPGVKVDLDVQDTACDAQTGVNAVNKLITDGVNIVVGFHCSAAALPSLPLLNRAQIPVIVSQALHPAITASGYKGVFRVISTTAQEGPAAAKILLHTFGGKTFAMVNDNTAVQKSLMEQTAVAVRKGGGKVVYTTAITPGSNEFGVNVAQIMALKPDDVFLALYYPEGAQLTKQLIQAGYQGHILNGDAGVDPNFIKIAGESVAEKTSFITQPITSQFPAAKPFIAAYTAKFHQAPGVLSAYTYDAMKVALDVIQKTHSVAYGPLVKALHAYSGQHVTGKIEFDENGQLKTGVFTRVVVRNGDFVAASK